MSTPEVRKKVPARPGKNWLKLLLPLVLGAGTGYLLARLAIAPLFFREHLSALSLWHLLGLPLAVLLVIAVHEAGHLAGGLSRGMRFLLYVVGPFQISRSDQGLRFNWVFNLGTFGGLAACLPDPDKPLRQQLIWLVLGGPLASLLLAVIAMLLAIVLEGAIAAWSLIIALLSAIIFLVTAAPFRSGGFMSDGAQFLEVRRGGEGVTARHRLSMLMGQSLAGRRPSEWDGALVEAALASEDPEPLRRVAARHLAYLHAVDRGESARADQLARQLGESIGDFPQGFRQSIAVELVIHHALLNDDRETAREWLAQARGGLVDPARKALAEAAAAEDPSVCVERIATARKKLLHGSDPGMNLLTQTQIEQLASRRSDV
jgi:hypothetical protein